MHVTLLLVVTYSAKLCVLAIEEESSRRISRNSSCIFAPFKTVSVASKICVNKKRHLLHCNDVDPKHLIHTNSLIPSLLQFIQMYNCRITLHIFGIKRFCSYLSHFVLRKYVHTSFFFCTNLFGGIGCVSS